MPLPSLRRALRRRRYPRHASRHDVVRHGPRRRIANICGAYLPVVNEGGRPCRAKPGPVARLGAVAQIGVIARSASRFVVENARGRLAPISRARIFIVTLAVGLALPRSAGRLRRTSEWFEPAA